MVWGVLAVDSKKASIRESSGQIMSVWNPNFYYGCCEREIDSSQCLTYNSTFIFKQNPNRWSAGGESCRLHFNSRPT